MLAPGMMFVVFALVVIVGIMGMIFAHVVNSLRISGASLINFAQTLYKKIDIFNSYGKV